MRGAARTLAPDEPEPPRDLPGEAAALIAGAAALQAAGERLADRDDPAAVVEMSNLVMRYGENSAALREVADALREHGFAVRHAHAAGVALGEARAAARMVPRQRRRAGQCRTQEPLPLFLVENAPAAADLS
jgi:hypothetical protein